VILKLLLLGPALAPLFLPGCSQTNHDSSAELFKLQSECANQARQFEADWRHQNGSDFNILLFSNHYNRATGHCYVRISYGQPGSLFYRVDP
jgi:hypothetical protein